MPVDEPEMTAFLRRLIPNFERQCVGATAGQIDRLQEIAGRPLPPFYHWFLRTMGRDVGPFTKARQDLSVDSVLAAYDDGFLEPEPPFLLIAGDSNDDLPMLGFYNLDEPTRDDALVLTTQGFGSPRSRMYETFREMFARANLVAFRIRDMPRYCEGRFTDPERDVATKLDGVMADLGFVSPVTTGPYCKVLERADSAMSGWTNPSPRDRNMMFFDMGAQDDGALRRLLGEISTATGFEVQIDRWASPPAPRA